MVMTDPIADFLTRIRNANQAKHEVLEVPASNIKKGIAEILKREGFVKNVEVIEDDKQGIIRVFLKYGQNGASIIFSPKDIFEQEFKTSMRGYDKKEVDEFLDDVIKDYESYISQIQELRAENEKLKQELAAKPKAAPATSYVVPQAEHARVAQTATNFDILKRISRLEKEVFGKQITE